MFRKYFIDVYTKNYINFSGRARRQEFWMFQLFYYTALVALIVIAVIYKIPALILVVYALILGTIIPNFALIVRRFHDTNRSGWWLLAGFVPLLNIVVLIFLLLDSAPGTNQYGKNPKGIVNIMAEDDSNSEAA